MLHPIAVVDISEENDEQSTKTLIRGPPVDYHRSSICSLLLEQCLAKGSVPVLLTEDGTSLHTYSTLFTSISDLACFLKNKCQLQSSACVALLIGELPDSIVSALAIIFAGLKLMILDVTSPLTRLESICKKGEVQALIYSHCHSRTAQCLLWSCTRLSMITCINDEKKIPERNKNRPMLALADTQLWDAKVSHADNDDRIAGGWMNAYDGALFTHAEISEFANNIFEHLRPFLRQDWRVLEIGCGSGYTARVIAPHVAQYVATDSSPQMVNYLRTKLDPQQWPTITFDTVSAEDVEKHFSPNSFNLIIMNSVVHCFPTHTFLTNVIYQCIHLLDSSTGVLFIGDVMDLNKRDEMLDSIRDYQQVNPTSEVQLDLTHILYLPDNYFFQLSKSIGTNVAILPRIGTIDNELTRYDYDVLMSMTPSTDYREYPSKFSYTKSDFSGQGSIDELISLSRAVTLDMDAYITSSHAVDHHALRNYADWNCRMLQINETTIVPMFELDFPFLVCLLGSGAKMIVFDSFERTHQNIASCRRLTLAKFTRQQLTTILGDTHSTLSESTIVLVGIYENADVSLFHLLNQHHQGKETPIILWNEYCFDDGIDVCLMMKISHDTHPSLGLPIQNTLVAVVDDGCHLVPSNSKGRLCLGRDGLIFSTNLTARCNISTEEIFLCGSMEIFNGRYINLFEIERELERLPCIQKVWVVIVPDKKQDLIGAVYQVCDNAASFENISWFERFINYAKLCLPPGLIPVLWARVDSNVNDRHKLVEILLTTNKMHVDNQDTTTISFDSKIQHLVQNALNLDHVPTLTEDFLPERQTKTLLSYHLVRALQAERPDYTHTDLFRHRTVQDIIHYLQQPSSITDDDK